MAAIDTIHSFPGGMLVRVLGDRTGAIVKYGCPQKTARVSRRKAAAILIECRKWIG